MVRTRLEEKTYTERIERIVQELQKRNMDALYLTSGVSFLYVTGFSYIQTERPAALIIDKKGVTTFLGPVIEKEHIPLETKLITNVLTYLDYPGETHPIEFFSKALTDMGLGNKTIGIDNPAGAAGHWGYKGPKISEKLKTAKFVEAGEIIEQMRLIKSKEEVELLRESAKWSNLAHSLLQEYARPGLHDIEVSLRASSEATRIMLKTLGPDYVPLKWSQAPAAADFRGQVGSMSAIPHSIATSRLIDSGDVLVTGAGAEVGGYTAELERTLIVGKPTEMQRKYFETMVKAQHAALDAFKPRAKCSDVDKAARQAISRAGYTKFIRHHTGHGIGLDGHEPPWLDVGDDTVLQPGMVLSCEPGIYIPNYAGFRHSDTVVITEDGAEVITYYPRDIDSLTIE